MAEKTVASANGAEILDLAVPFDIESLFGMNQKFCKTMMVCNEELITFGRNRLKEDLDVPQKLAECKSPQDVMNVYLGFYQTALKQYTDEASHLTKICTEMNAESLEPVELLIE
ncbi:MAG: phasin family protein [Sneathiella sp.]|nr:phasin family protein [Sneathiella sp.]